MRTRKLGNSDLNVTTIGFGTWAIGGSGWAFAWGHQDDDDSVKAIQKGLDLGINWVDTAPVYGLGHAEEIVAKALKGRRDKVILATKCALVWDEKRKLQGNLKKQSIRDEIDKSLKRLKTDYVDLYQIHWPNPDKDIEEGWEEVCKIVEQGKVRYAGVSNFNAQQLERAQKVGPITSLQPPYSMLERSVEGDIYGFCEQNNIGVVAYSPLQVGMLTGKFSKERIDNLPNDDWRRTKSPHFKEPLLSANLDLVEELKPIAERHNKTLSQLAIAWTLRLPVVTSAIVGARKPEQIEETVGGDWKIPSEAVSEIETLLKEREEKLSKLL